MGTRNYNSHHHSHTRPGSHRPPDRTKDPQTVDEVLDWLSAGHLSPGQAFALFRTIDGPRLMQAAAKARGQDRGVAELPEAQPDEDAERLRRLEAVMQELNALIGLQSVKQLVLELQAFIEIQRRRVEQRLLADKTALHMVFKGNPGTGKTTVARVLGRMFRELNALPKGHLVECERADLVGEYIGHTAQRTRERIRKALGGILFVDEAYALARGGEKDFGKEAIDTLVKSMEDHKDEFVVILAGYRDEMDWFLKSNPGLQSRFPIQIDFPDYSNTELLSIAELMCGQRQYKLSSGAKQRLFNSLERKQRSPFDGNARYVRNVLERAMRRQAVRLVRRRQLTRDDLMTLDATDVWEAIIETQTGPSVNTPTPGSASPTGTTLPRPFVVPRGTGMSVG